MELVDDSSPIIDPIAGGRLDSQRHGVRGVRFPAGPPFLFLQLPILASLLVIQSADY